jgi:CBS domain containing-hemolysin-like protein
MRSWIFWPGMLTLVLSAAPRLAIAGSAPSSGAATAEIGASAEVAPQPVGIVQPRTIAPLVAELLAVVAQEQKTLAELRNQIAKTHNNTVALDLQRQVEAVKRETELTLLRIQAAHARREGRLEVAARLDEIILHRTTPQAPPIVARPGNSTGAP